MSIINVHFFFSQSYLKTIVCYYSLDFFLRFACRRIFQSNFSPFLYAKAKSFDKQQNVFSAFAVVLVVLGICIIFDWASTERKHFTTKIRVPPIISQELEHSNRQKILSSIQQRFLCLLDGDCKNMQSSNSEGRSGILK